MANRKPKKDTEDQRAKFISIAREYGCDEDETSFERNLHTIAKAKAKPKPKKQSKSHQEE